MKVNKLSSSKTSLPYEYYSLPFCKPDKVTLPRARACQHYMKLTRVRKSCARKKAATSKS